MTLEDLLKKNKHKLTGSRAYGGSTKDSDYDILLAPTTDIVLIDITNRVDNYNLECGLDSVIEVGNTQLLLTTTNKWYEVNVLATDILVFLNIDWKSKESRVRTYKLLLKLIYKNYLLFKISITDKGIL